MNDGDEVKCSECDNTFKRLAGSRLKFVCSTRCSQRRHRRHLAHTVPAEPVNAESIESEESFAAFQSQQAYWQEVRATRARQMLLDGYDIGFVEERFGSVVLRQARSMMTTEEKVASYGARSMVDMEHNCSGRAGGSLYSFAAENGIAFVAHRNRE